MAKHRLGTVPHRVRFRKDMVARLRESAAKAGRSLSEEVEWRLENSFEPYDLERAVRRIESDKIIARALREKGVAGFSDYAITAEPD